MRIYCLGIKVYSSLNRICMKLAKLLQATRFVVIGRILEQRYAEFVPRKEYYRTKKRDENQNWGGGAKATQQYNNIETFDVLTARSTLKI